MAVEMLQRGFRPPEARWSWAMIAVASGAQFQRRLTHAERLAICLAYSKPLSHLTLHSRDLDSAAVRSSFRKLVKRVERRLSKGRRKRRPWIYFGCYACAKDGLGYHVHLLLWDYIDLERLLIPQAKHVGFGVDLRKIGPMQNTPYSTSPAFRLATYLVGQHEPVFGSKDALRHLPRPKDKRAWIYPQTETLATERPELLAAINDAKDRSIGDEELCQRWARSIS